MKKYEFTGVTVNHFGRRLHEIKRLSDGLIGGYIESERNLSHDGDCFVYNNAKVFGNARVSDNTWVFGNAEVFDNARVYGYARVSGNAEVFGNAQVSGNAQVFGNAKVSDNARVFGNAEAFDNARVFGNAQVSGNAQVFGNAKVSGNAVATGRVQYISTYKHNITLTDNHIQIGCECHTIEHWKENIADIGKANGYTKLEVKAVKQMLNGLLNMHKGK
jgi:carbonic anhydrase/acetyltransferase-like protein (isoleucine patch superfamily)